jgi:hypothetical protein
VLSLPATPGHTTPGQEGAPATQGHPMGPWSLVFTEGARKGRRTPVAGPISITELPPNGGRSTPCVTRRQHLVSRYHHEQHQGIASSQSLKPARSTPMCPEHGSAEVIRSGSPDTADTV